MAITTEIGFEQIDDLKATLAGNDAGKALAPCQRLLGTITKQDRIDALVGPKGPRLEAARMHP